MELKENIQNLFAETLTEEEKLLVSVASVICVEGLDIETLFHIQEPNSPHLFYDIVDSLCKGNWLFQEHKRVYCNMNVVKAVLEKGPIDTNVLKTLLINLEGFLSIEPLDDYLSRQQYFVAARLLLPYIMEEWGNIVNKDYSFIMSFMTNVIKFASNVELSFHRNKRQSVGSVEERIDYKLLSFIANITGDEKLYELIGSLYVNIFRYDDANYYFKQVEDLSLHKPSFLISLSEMYWNLGIIAKSFKYAYNAYLINKEENNNDKNIEVCLYLAYLCGENELSKSCKQWLQEGKKLIGKRGIPAVHPIRISFCELEALMTMDDYVKAFDLLDRAEMMTIKLYGCHAPRLSRISLIRQTIYDNIGQSRKSIEAYRDYVDYNHFNYGYSAGDISILYSLIIQSNIERGCYYTSGMYEVQMQDLHEEDITFAPGVRISKAFSEASTRLLDKEYEQCASFMEEARSIFVDEIKPDEKLVSDIKPIFYGNNVPDAVVGKDFTRALSGFEREIEIAKGEYNMARSLILNEIGKEDGKKERLLLEIHLARILIKEGNKDEGLKLWNEIIRQADISYKFMIAKEIAEWATDNELYYEAIEFYEIALQVENMLNAKTKELAVVLRNYADVLETCGMQDKTDEPWLQAINLLKSMNDRDGLALAYWYWGATKQDYKAEELLAKAIKYWKQEPGVFDETLSHMYRLYSMNLGMQGKNEKARIAAHKALNLYPSSDMPDYLYEDIESYM